MSRSEATGAVRGLDPEEQTRFAAARYLATRSQPYLGAALFAMTPFAVDELRTFGVDRRWRLYMDPDRLRKWTPEEAAAVLLHEVGHLVRDHAARGDRLGGLGTDDHHRWNIAGDLAINDDLVADGAGLPGAPVLPGPMGLKPGLLEEEYYALLGRTDQRPATAADCGSGADGHHRTWEIADGDQDRPGLPPAAATAVRIRVADAIRTAGTASAGWRRWAEGDTAGRPDWRQVLRTAVHRPSRWQAGRLDASWTRPDRREDAHPGLILPGARSPRLEIVIIIDTSGSITDAEAAAALAEVTAVQRQCGVRRLWAITCDSRPAPPQRVAHVGELELRGGGGTDLRPAIARLDTLRPRPDVAVIITDGWTPWPDRPPRGIVLIVATTDRPCPMPSVQTVTVDLEEGTATTRPSVHPVANRQPERTTG